MRRSVFLFFPANRPAVLCVSFLPLPPIPFPSFSSPAVPRGPGGARRSLFLPAGSPGRSWSRSRVRGGCRSLAAPQNGPPSPHESHRPPQAHPGYLGHRVDHPGHHPHHDSAGAVPGHCRHHLPGPNTPHAQQHRVSHGHWGTATSLGWGLQPWDPVPGTLTGHPESWSLGRSWGGPVPRAAPVLGSHCSFCPLSAQGLWGK